MMKICFVIVTHNRRPDFNNLISSIEDNIDTFVKYNVDVVVVDNESDVPVKSSHLYKLHRVEDQDAGGGLVGAWEFITTTYIRDYNYFIYSNHDVILNGSIAQYFKALIDNDDHFVLGPSSHIDGANPHQIAPYTEDGNVDINTHEKLPKERDLIHGFFWGTNVRSLQAAKYSTYRFFNPHKPFGGSEDDWQFRLLGRQPETRFLVERTAFVTHRHYSDWKTRG